MCSGKWSLEAIQKNRFLLALVSTVSASLSTLSNLFLFKGEEHATAFIHIYSSMVLTSACLNSYIFFGGTYAGRLSERLQGIVSMVLCFFCSAFFVSVLFQESLSLAHVFFLLASLLPVLFSPFYRFAFRGGLYFSAYARTIFLNFAFLLASVFAWVGREPTAIYFYTGILFVPGILWFLFDPFFKIEVKQRSAAESRAVFNPSLPLLERSLFDQMSLSRAGMMEYTWVYYFVSRLISFSGTVFFTFSTEKLLSREVKSARLYWRYVWLVLFLISTSAFFFSGRSLKVAVVLSQLLSWLVSNWLISLHEARSYWLVFSFVALDAVSRWMLLNFVGSDGELLAKGLIVSTMFFSVLLVVLGSKKI